MEETRCEGAYRRSFARAFPGVDRRAARDGAREMVNFRIADDGTLIKRCGYDSVLSLPGEPRAVFSGFHDGREILYFLIGDTVFCRDAASDTGYSVVDTIDSAEGEASFASFLGCLYLFDGEQIYAKRKGGFIAIEGYIPLYGREWDPIDCGEVFESENLLTRRVRIHYRNAKQMEEVRFGRRVLSVDRVVADETEIPLQEVRLSENGLECTCPAFSDYANIEVTVTLNTSNKRPRIAGCRNAYVYGGAGETRVFCYGGSDAMRLYGSYPVSSSEAERSEMISGTLGGDLYFPIDRNVYHVGAPVTALCRHFDRVLIFTSGGLWAVDCTDDVSVVRVHDTIGCDKRGCAVLCGDDPIAYFDGKLYRFRAKSNARNEYSAEVLSAPIAEEFAALVSESVQMCCYDGVGELWMISPEAHPGTVWIYHPKKDAFYTFSGVYAERLIASGDEPMLIYGEKLWKFDERLLTDRGTETVTAYYESGAIDFGVPECHKRLLRAFVECDPGGGEIVMRCYGEKGCAAVSLIGDGNGMPNAYDRRVSIGRFRLMRSSFTASGEARQRIYSRLLICRR